MGANVFCNTRGYGGPAIIYILAREIIQFKYFILVDMYNMISIYK